MIQLVQSKQTELLDGGESFRDSTKSTWWTVIEWFSLVLLVIAVHGQSPPDVNETHYLTKAKHFWNPDWCRGDLFLESHDSHWLFFVTTGWVTQYVPLNAFAWIGRLVTWGVFCICWLGMIRMVIPYRWSGLLSLGLFLLLNERFHLAGEWVVGGFEAKSIAMVFELAAIWALLGNRLGLGVLATGAAIGFHPLAGGWFLVAALFASFNSSRLSFATIEETVPTVIWSTKLNRSFFALAFFAVVFGVAGILPPVLSQTGASNQDLAEAARIQVTYRLSHHLLFGAFETPRVAAFVLLVCFWLGLRKIAAGNAPLLWMNRLAFAGILFNVAGLVLSAIAKQDTVCSEVSLSLLRLYWFRFADLALPLVVACSVAKILLCWLSDVVDKRRMRIAGIATIVLAIAVALHIAEAWQDRRPRADQAALMCIEGDSKKNAEIARNWRAACSWIREHTPQDAIFITPADQQTFKWYAERAEVVCWKDMPQDPVTILTWRDRIDSLYRPQREYELGLFAYSDDQLSDLADRYGADYLVVPQREYEAASTDGRFQIVYPEDSRRRTTYVVLRVTRKSIVGDSGD